MASFLGKYAICRIYNGVDTEIFKYTFNSNIYSKYNISNPYLIAVATSWSERKGFNDYLKLRTLLPNSVDIVLVGLSSKLISRLPQGIIGIKRTESREELASLYSAASAVLNLSYQETFGLTTVEGLACGTPGIVYDCTATPELIDNQTGFVVSPGDINAVCSAVHKILSNTRASYSQNCRNRAVNLFDSKKCYQEYLHLYESLL